MCGMRNPECSPPRLLGRGNWEERELEGREQRIWGEVANLVITFAAAAAAAATPPAQERSRQKNTR